MTNSEILTSLQCIYGPGIFKNTRAIKTLDFADLKKTFRKRALQVHPDRFIGLGSHVVNKKKDEFIKLKDAYEQVSEFLNGRIILEDDLETRKRRWWSNKKKEKKESVHAEEKINFRYWEPGNLKADPTFDEIKSKLPKKELLFGELLYHSGIISWDELIAAIVWQRQNIKRLGEIARTWGWFDEDDISHLLPFKRNEELFGEFLLRFSVISEINLKILLCYQNMHKPKIGEYFRNNRIISGSKMDKYLSYLKIHNNAY